jgi:hypothetical protein
MKIVATNKVAMLAKVVAMPAKVVAMLAKVVAMLAAKPERFIFICTCKHQSQT